MATAQLDPGLSRASPCSESNALEGRCRPPQTTGVAVSSSGGEQALARTESASPDRVGSGQDRGFDTSGADRTQNKGGPPLCLRLGDSG
jgi:hypothetical protein